MRIQRIALALMLPTLLGCSVLVAPYEATSENVRILKSMSAQPVTVVAVTAAPGVNSLTARGNPLRSPVGHTFQEYLKDALEQELNYARLLSDKAATRITGHLTENEMSAASISRNSASIAAEFSVSRDNTELYRRTQYARHEWESSFMGAIAIPRAISSYPKVVELLLRQLYLDPNFVAALQGESGALKPVNPSK